MRLRVATTRDLARIVEITQSSLQDDPAFVYLWPKRRLYPDDSSFFWGIHLKKLLYEPSIIFLVVELDDNDAKITTKAPEKHTANDFSEPHTVISYGIWERIGNDTAAKRRANEKNNWRNVFDRFTAWLERRSIAYKYSRRDGSPARQAAAEAATKAAREEFFYHKGIKAWWSMELLVTDRPYRRRGAASMIVQWGCGAADAEGVWAGVEASPMGEPVYELAGFAKRGSQKIKVEDETEELLYTIMMRPGKAGFEAELIPDR